MRPTRSVIAFLRNERGTANNQGEPFSPAPMRVAGPPRLVKDGQVVHTAPLPLHQQKRKMHRPAHLAPVQTLPRREDLDDLPTYPEIEHLLATAEFEELMNAEAWFRIHEEFSVQARMH